MGSRRTQAGYKMPMFYFDIDAEQRDKDGVELRDLNQARAEAIRAAGEILRDIGGRLAGNAWGMRVRDARGRIVLNVRFSLTERQP
jgi:hypothetical protein